MMTALAKRIVCQYVKQDSQFDDAMSWAFFRMAEGLRKYDPTKKTKLSTFLWFYARSGVFTFLRFHQRKEVIESEMSPEQWYHLTEETIDPSCRHPIEKLHREELIETIRQFMLERVGKEWTDYLLDYYLLGINEGHLDKNTWNICKSFRNELYKHRHPYHWNLPKQKHPHGGPRK